uniref:TipAS domain-containing protein n=1 Tax=Meloidogyne hapla TaxID=6305 RepID=A0A1I8BK57_MELHA
MRIINSIELEDCHDNERAIQNILVEKGRQELEKAGLPEDEQNVSAIYPKIRAVIEYYDNILGSYQQELLNRINRMSRDQKLLFINKRMFDYGQFYDEAGFREFIESYGLNSAQMIRQDNNLNTIPNTLRNIE